MAKAAKKKVAKKAMPSKDTIPSKDTTPVEQPIVEEQFPVQDDAQLTIADLQALAQVIEMAVRRGAFGANELTEVGAVFDKLNNFLQVIAAQKQAAEKLEGGQ